VLKQGQSVRSLAAEEEGAAETTCDELIAIPTPHPPARVGGRGGREIGSEVEPGKKEGVGGGVFKDLVLFLIILI